METIYKYGISTETELELPTGSEILHVEEQYGLPYIWVFHDTDKQKIKRKFKVFATGEEFPSDLTFKFIGTFLLRNRGLVFHLYEIF